MGGGVKKTTTLHYHRPRSCASIGDRGSRPVSVTATAVIASLGGAVLQSPLPHAHLPAGGDGEVKPATSKDTMLQLLLQPSQSRAHLSSIAPQLKLALPQSDASGPRSTAPQLVVSYDASLISAAPPAEIL